MMMRSLAPAEYMNKFRGQVRSAIKRRVEPIFSRMVMSEISTIQQIAALFPHAPGQRAYTLPAYFSPAKQTGFPVPPRPLWANYCTCEQSYLQSGADDITTMRRLLSENGAQIAELDRILELGVAGGRLIRHLANFAEHQEIWGVDVWASAILWCQENLSPPFHFATTTLHPHLPFEDRSFGLVIGGSVWTHLDDLAEAWALEVHRILRPRGFLYFSLNDRSAVKIFNGEGRDRTRYIERVTPANWKGWLDFLENSAEYQRFAKGEAQMVTIGRSTTSHVMWDVDYLIRRWGPGWKIRSVTPEAYGHQTCVLLERR